MPNFIVHVVHEYFEAGDFEVEANDADHAESLARELAKQQLTDPELSIVTVAVTLKATGPCLICKVRMAVAGVYCQFCLDRETENMGSDELF